MDTTVQVQGLRKVYGTTVAVDEISFTVHEGEIFGMIGPNGAGKTTTIECLEGLRKPDKGTIRVLDLDPQDDNRILREKIGAQLQESNLPDRMKVWEALDLYTSFYEHTLDWEELIVELGLEEKRNASFSKLSGGQKQRLFIALALLPDPQLVFLDELTTGLDPQARHAIWDLVSDVRARGKTVILTTHFMEEAEKLCDHVAILDHGKIVALDTPAALICSLGMEERVVFTLKGILPAGFKESLSGEVSVEIQGDLVTISGKNGRKTPLVSEVVSKLSEQALSFSDLRTEQPNLEDVFLRLTGRKIRE
jgi:ABC-2 type transport system ATP-binding protein